MTQGIFTKYKIQKTVVPHAIAEAVDRAVSERLERLRRRRNRKALAERLLKIGDQCGRLPVLDSRAR